MVYPDVSGAANWWSPSFSPDTGLFYQLAYDGGSIYQTGDVEKREEGVGRFIVGGSGDSGEYHEHPAPSYVSAVRALEPLSGRMVWEHRIEPKSTSGLLSTAGNLVFGGSAKGVFFALDARTGQELWQLDLGGRVHAAPVTYLVGDEQFVTIAADCALFTFGL